MPRSYALLVAAVLWVTSPVSVEAQNKFDWKPGFMIPVGLDLNGGIGTWGSRVGLIVGKVTKGDDGIRRAFGPVILAEAATNEYQAVGVGVAIAGGLGIGPFVPLPMGGARITVNRASYNPYRNNTRRTATGVSMALTYPLLSYAVTLYRVDAQPGLNAGWQWRLGLGLGF